MVGDITLSVLMMVYNHEAYLAKAIESVLMQKVNFTYELLIQDDCSTDGSREIIKKYKELYPGIIVAIFHEKNVGMDEAVRLLYERARGRYIAYLEGDDFWTNKNKLNIQVSFLEQNQEYSACYHSVEVIDENGKTRETQYPYYTYDMDADYVINSWRENSLPGHTSSRLERNMYGWANSSMIKEFWRCRANEDMKAVVMQLVKGKVRQMGKTMSCYRLSFVGYSWNALVKGKDIRDKWYISYMEVNRLAQCFLNAGTFDYHKEIHLLKGVLEDYFSGKRSTGTILKNMVSYDIFHFLYFLSKIDYSWVVAGKDSFLLPHLGKNLKMRLAPENNYVIFGTGKMGEACWQWINRIGAQKNVLWFWDNAPERIGRRFHAQKVLKPFCKTGNMDFLVLVASTNYKKEMLQQLKTLGYVLTYDVICFHDCLKETYFTELGRQWPLLFGKRFCKRGIAV